MGWEEVTKMASVVAPIKAPFPWFGGKSRAAPLLWQLLGNCPNYVEPFAGSLAVLLGRLHRPGIETVNDRDAFLCNIFRARQRVPEEVARWCDLPVNEADQHANHVWLVNQRNDFTARLMGDPDCYDAKVAGRWLYGICCWIGSGWCSGDGPWASVDGQLVHLGDAGRGVHRQRVHLGHAGRGSHGRLYPWFVALQERLRYVRVCCGDWSRVMGPSVTFKHGVTGIVFDPPSSTEEDRQENLYACEDLHVAHDVRSWCQAHGHHPLLRIVLCGYGEVHDVLLEHGWTKRHWCPNGGFANQGDGRGRTNKHRETVWASPGCLTPIAPKQMALF